jgi:hypothetical protein
VHSGERTLPTDTVYSQMVDGEIRSRIGSLGSDKISESEDDIYMLFREFLAWREDKN